MWRWLQVLEQERHQLRLRLEEVEDEQQQRLLELAADAAALRWVRRRIYQDLSGSITTIEHVPSMFHFVSKSDLSTGQHWSALRAMQGWLKDRSNPHLNTTFTYMSDQTCKPCIHASMSVGKTPPNSI